MQRSVIILLFGTIASCSYDFDRFVQAANRGGSQGPGGATAGGTAQLGGAGQGGTELAVGGLPPMGSGGRMTGGTSATGGAGGGVSDGGPEDASSDTGVPYCDRVGGTTYAGHCYYVSSMMAQWSTAVTNCASQDGFHLVTITSAEEQAAIAALMVAQPVARDYWMGLSEPAGTASQKKESNFEWVTAPAEHYDSLPNRSYRNWGAWTDADLEPNFTGDCVRLRYTDPLVSGKVGAWADCQCTDALLAICEHD